MPSWIVEHSWILIVVFAVGTWEALKGIILSATGHTQKQLKQSLQADIAAVETRLGNRIAPLEQKIDQILANAGR